jgi:thioredoxin-related protein
MSIPLRRTLAVAAVLLAVSAAGAMAGDDWSHDWKAAKARAAAEKKDILIDFNGSDWCGWCQRLTREVFSQEAFRKAAPEKFVLFEVDFVRQPENVAKQSKDVRLQNLRLIAEFGVRGFPSIYVADEQGRPYAKTGYKKGGPEPYLEHLAELEKVREKRDALFARAAEAEGPEKAKFLNEALEAIKMPVFPFYAGVAAEILAADPEDTLGLKEKFGKDKAAEVAFQQVLSFVGNALRDPGVDLDALLAELDRVKAYAGDKGENAQRWLATHALVTWIKTNPADQNKRDVNLLLAGYQKAVEAAPDSDLANGPRGLKVAISDIKKQLAASK